MTRHDHHGFSAAVALPRLSYILASADADFFYIWSFSVYKTMPLILQSATPRESSHQPHALHRDAYRTRDIARPFQLIFDTGTFRFRMMRAGGDCRFRLRLMSPSMRWLHSARRRSRLIELARRAALRFEPLDD